MDAAAPNPPAMNARPVFSSVTLSRTTTFGASCVIPSPVIAEALGRSGLDWVMIDCQHGLIGFEAMVGMLQALAISPVLPLVRVAANDPAEIARALDAGAGGVIVPMVGSRSEAEAAVRAVRYAPVGTRSWGPTRALWRAPVATDPEEGLLFVMIETADAFRESEEIVGTPGVDGVWVGTSDLAVSLGLAPREHLHPRIREHVTELARLCRGAGMATAIGAQTPEQATVWLDAGYGMLSLGRDLAVLTGALAAQLEAYRDLPGAQAGAAESA
jgi:4-hydroxy-2-oxoheptanedioate aldolase